MKKILMGLLVASTIITMAGCTNNKVTDKGAEVKEQAVEETKESVVEETKEPVVEETKEPVIPETIEANIGDEIVLKEAYGDREVIFKVDNVYLTENRNRFADPVNYVVIIEYSVTNINIPAESFYFDLGFMNGKFYDANGSECKTYPTTVVDTFGVHDISPNRSSSSAVAIGITCDKPYLEMEIANILYKFNL